MSRDCTLSLTSGPAVGLYLHFPYCRQRCSYCDFNSHLTPTNGAEVYQDYHVALLKEIRTLPHAKVASIFWGGGTPSLMPLPHLIETQKAISHHLTIAKNIENTLEVNPATMGVHEFSQLLSHGWNRLSLGVQAFQPEILALVGRIHSVEDVTTTVAAGRQAGFDNISLDLIYGFPQQTLSQWRQSLDMALTLQPEHLSIYCLAVEPSTRLEVQLRTGELSLPPEELRDAMADLSTELLTGAGFVRYEISNWARPGRESLHNLGYWRDHPYLAVGCGAVSYLDGWRQHRIKPPAYYQKALAEGRSPIIYAERRSADGLLKDTLMMGLRIDEGVAVDNLQARYPGLDPEQLHAFFCRLPHDWWTFHNGRYRLTPKGWDFHSDVTMALMDVLFSFEPDPSLNEEEVIDNFSSR